MLPISLPGAFRRLYTMLGVLDGPSEPTQLDSTVKPTVDLAELLRVSAIKGATLTGLTTGENVALTVPAGKRWRLWAYAVARTSGDRNVNYCQVQTPDGDKFTFDTFTAASSRIYLVPGQPLPLDQGWILDFNITGGTTDGNWTFDAFVTEEDAY